jgi:LytS/YehU family sensor histidine kinase
MHPILASRQRLLLYLAAWFPVAGLLTAFVAEGLPAWYVGATTVLPMTMLYAAVCLASWYVCKAAPLEGRTTLRALATVVVAAIFSTVVWMVIAYAWVALVDVPLFPPDRYLQQMTVIFTCGVVLFLLAAAMHYLLLMVEESRNAEKNALQLQVLAREAELRALRAQIDPHFLFNCLNSISALTTQNSEGARRMCLLLAEFLRSSLRLGAEDQIPFRDEMKLAESFLDIEKIRFGDRLAVDRRIDSECYDCLVPPLLIQPLVENAVKHGIAALVNGGILRIEAKRSGPHLEILLANPVDVAARTQLGTGVGLKNVRERIRNMFADDGRIDVENTGDHFRVRLRVPCQLRSS